MKLLLIEPPQQFLAGQGQTGQALPLGLGYIGAFLASDHDVRLLLPDTRAYEGDDPWGELKTAIREEAPDIVGLTAVTASYGSALRVAEVVKEVDSEIFVVLGGVHASTEPISALRGAPAVDFVVVGEGEQTMAELLAALEASRGGEGLAPEEIAGLVWRDGEDIRLSTHRPPIRDLDALPFPLRENLVWSDGIHSTFYQALITLRGCPYRCIYCAVPSSNDRLTRYRSAENVVAEIALLKERYDVPDLFFHDSVFTLHRKRTVEICQSMVDRDLVTPFHCQTRADRVDAELLETMKEAGCEQIFFGIESGDVDSLRRIRKQMSLDTIREAVRMVKALDILCSGFFMIGFPWETEEQMERTADFATSLDLDTVSLFSATPLPGTELWEMAGGAQLPDSIDFRTPQVNTTRLSDERYSEVYGHIKRRIDEHNQAQMMRQVEDLTAGRGSPRLKARLNRQDGNSGSP